MERGQKSAEIFISPTESRLEAGAGIEPANRGFADLGLTTWLPRQMRIGIVVRNLSVSTVLRDPITNTCYRLLVIGEQIRQSLFFDPELLLKPLRALQKLPPVGASCRFSRNH
jgi:hypothetical protein